MSRKDIFTMKNYKVIQGISIFCPIFTLPLPNENVDFSLEYSTKGIIKTVKMNSTQLQNSYPNAYEEYKNNPNNCASNLENFSPIITLKKSSSQDISSRKTFQILYNNILSPEKKFCEGLTISTSDNSFCFCEEDLSAVLPSSEKTACATNISGTTINNLLPNGKRICGDNSICKSPIYNSRGIMEACKYPDSSLLSGCTTDNNGSFTYVPELCPSGSCEGILKLTSDNRPLSCTRESSAISNSVCTSYSGPSSDDFLKSVICPKSAPYLPIKKTSNISYSSFQTKDGTSLIDSYISKENNKINEKCYNSDSLELPKICLTSDMCSEIINNSQEYFNKNSIPISSSIANCLPSGCTSTFIEGYTPGKNGCKINEICRGQAFEQNTVCLINNKYQLSESKYVCSAQGGNVYSIVNNCPSSFPFGISHVYKHNKENKKIFALDPGFQLDNNKVAQIIAEESRSNFEITYERLKSLDNIITLSTKEKYSYHRSGDFQYMLHLGCSKDFRANSKISRACPTAYCNGINIDDFIIYSNIDEKITYTMCIDPYFLTQEITGCNFYSNYTQNSFDAATCPYSSKCEGIIIPSDLGILRCVEKPNTIYSIRLFLLLSGILPLLFLFFSTVGNILDPVQKGSMPVNTIFKLTKKSSRDQELRRIKRQAEKNNSNYSDYYNKIINTLHKIRCRKKVDDNIQSSLDRKNHEEITLPRVVSAAVCSTMKFATNITFIAIMTYVYAEIIDNYKKYQEEYFLQVNKNHQLEQNNSVFLSLSFLVGTVAYALSILFLVRIDLKQVLCKSREVKQYTHTDKLIINADVPTKLITAIMFIILYSIIENI